MVNPTSPNEATSPISAQEKTITGLLEAKEDLEGSETQSSLLEQRKTNSKASEEAKKVSPSWTYRASAGPTSAWLEVIGSGKEGRVGNGCRLAGRPPIQTDRRILETILKLHREGHPWPRLCELLEPVCRKYGGPYPLSIPQCRRLALKAAKILGAHLKKRQAGRPWEYYRQIKKTGGA